MDRKRKPEDVLTTRNGTYKRPRNHVPKPRRRTAVDAPMIPSGTPLVNKPGPAAHAVARTYELVEAILVHLPMKDIEACMGSDYFFSQVAEDSLLVRRHIFEPLPPGYDTVWRAGYDSTGRQCIQVYRGPMQLNMALALPPIRYFVPVTPNETLMRPGYITDATPEHAREHYAHPRLTDEEAYSFLACKLAAPRGGRSFKLKIDIAQLHPGSELLDEFLSSPPVTKARITLANPEGIMWTTQSGRKWEGNYRPFVATRAEGVRLRDLVETVAEAGLDWLGQMSPTGVDGINLRSEWASPFGKWVYDFVERHGSVYYPDQSRFGE